MNLKAGDIVTLRGGHSFTVTEELSLIYRGFVTLGMSMFGAATMGTIMFKSTGDVYDSLTNTFYDNYIEDVKLPIGLPQVTCQCGGFKTYNSMATHCHSHWCPVNTTEVKNGCEPISWCN